jgi:hypothetical protein
MMIAGAVAAGGMLDGRMASYRYSEAGIERLVRRSAVRSLVLVGAAFGAGLLVFLRDGPGRTEALAFAGVLAAALAFAMWKAAGRTRMVLGATEIEITPSELVCRGYTGTVTIGRGEVRAVKVLKDGMVVRGPRLGESVVLRRELDGFEELARQVEAWIPPGVRRTRTSWDVGARPVLVVTANLLLFVAAMASKDPRVAIPCSVAEAAILAGCGVWVWRNKSIAGRWKWRLLIVVIPVLGLLGRAAMLAMGR